VKELSLAVLMYAQDYDERFPVHLVTSDWWTAHNCDACWQDSIQPYVKNTQIEDCPSSNLGTFHVNSGRLAGQDVHISYAWNCGWMNWISMAQIIRPSSKILLGDGWGDPRLSPTNPTNWNTCYGSNAWHNGGANFAFCDGHAKWLRYPVYFQCAVGSCPYFMNDDTSP
jgi:prepilin-type processing-associated H-X9-DG protein